MIERLRYIGTAPVVVWCSPIQYLLPGEVIEASVVGQQVIDELARTDEFLVVEPRPGNQLAHGPNKEHGEPEET